MASRDPHAEGGAPSQAELAGRLERLSRQLDVERDERAASLGPARSDTAGMGAAVKLASEFVAGVVVGAALGWGIDYIAGTSPWGLIVFLMLGFAAGVTNAVRVAGKKSGS